jgi:hypothetical protein
MHQLARHAVGVASGQQVEVNRGRSARLDLVSNRCRRSVDQAALDSALRAFEMRGSTVCCASAMRTDRRPLLIIPAHRCCREATPSMTGRKATAKDSAAFVFGGKFSKTVGQGDGAPAGVKSRWSACSRPNRTGAADPCQPVTTLPGSLRLLWLARAVIGNAADTGRLRAGAMQSIGFGVEALVRAGALYADLPA